jgi:hypothetical protein
MTRPFQIYDSGTPLVFDGNEAVCFIVNLRNNVKTARVKNIAPGARYTFVIHQDSLGQHTFAWPSKCENAMMVDPAANATTVQSFIGTTGGMLLADIPATWTK